MGPRKRAYVHTHGPSRMRQRSCPYDLANGLTFVPMESCGCVRETSLPARLCRLNAASARTVSGALNLAVRGRFRSGWSPLWGETVDDSLTIANACVDSRAVLGRGLLFPALNLESVEHRLLECGSSIEPGEQPVRLGSQQAFPLSKRGSHVRSEGSWQGSRFRR